MLDIPYTTPEFDTLPERAQHYIRGLETATKLIKETVAATQNENKTLIHKKIDMWDILTGAATTSILNNVQLRDETLPLVDADNIHLFPSESDIALANRA